MAHPHRAVLLAMVALAALGCSGDPGSGGDQPYGAGTNGSDDVTPLPDAGAGTGGVSGSAGMSGGAGGDVIAGAGGVSGASGSGGEGGSGELPSCGEAPQPPLVGACVLLPEPGSGEFVSMTGVVETVERVDSASCANRALGTMTTVDEGEIYEILIGDGSSAVVITTQIPWGAPLVSAGDMVSVEYKAELPMNSVGHGVLTLRDAEGSLLLWVVQAARGFDSVGLPELMIFDDESKCIAAGPCASTSTHGGIRAYDFVNEVTIGFGEIGEVGDFFVQAVDNTKVDLSTSSCGFVTSDFHRVVIVAMPIFGIPPD